MNTKARERIEICQREKQEVLDLSFCALYAIDQTLFTKLNWVKRIDLEGNQLSALPDSITQLSNLTHLDLGGNQLSTLPDSITQLSNLTHLNLGDNQLSALPDSIDQLSNLTQLYLWGNQLSALPDSITQLSNLNHLNLSRNNLSTLPDSITQLSNLTHLDLSHNNLSTLPDSITQLSNLTHLDLSHNNLSTLPDSITQLSNLTDLNLGDNQLSTLPDSITQLSNLTHLDLGGNQLSPLPDSFTQLSNLTRLDLGRNNLSTLPDSITQLSNLTHLNLGGNQLSPLPDSITQLSNLTDLNLGDNQLSALPDSIDQLSNLTQLYLWGNQLHEQYYLPFRNRKNDESRLMVITFNKSQKFWRYETEGNISCTSKGNSPATLQKTWLSLSETVTAIIVVAAFTSVAGAWVAILYTLLTPLLMLKTESSLKEGIQRFLSEDSKIAFRLDKHDWFENRVTAIGPIVAVWVKVKTTVQHLFLLESWMAIPRNYEILALRTDAYRPPELVPGMELIYPYCSHEAVSIKDFKHQSSAISKVSMGAIFAITFIYRFVLKGSFFIFHWPLALMGYCPTWKSLTDEEKQESRRDLDIRQVIKDQSYHHSGKANTIFATLILGFTLYYYTGYTPDLRDLESIQVQFLAALKNTYDTPTPPWLLTPIILAALALKSYFLQLIKGRAEVLDESNTALWSDTNLRKRYRNLNGMHFVAILAFETFWFMLLWDLMNRWGI